MLTQRATEERGNRCVDNLVAVLQSAIINIVENLRIGSDKEVRICNS